MLKQLLDKPESYRKKVALFVTAILGIIIFTIWLIITQHNVQEAINTNQLKNVKTANQRFEDSLPKLNDNQTILTTELMRQQKKQK
jgi:hypothetical protein